MNAHTTRRRTDGSTRPRLLAAALAAAVGRALPIGLGSLALALVAAPARAQLTAVEPYAAVVTDDAVYLRCGAGTIWYPVAQLSKGDILRVDGHEFGWLRVAYPSGTPAIVKATDAKVDSARGVVTLTKRSQLLASNMEAGVKDSYRALLDNELPTGTELQLLGEVKDASGSVAGFRVAAPDGAKGFVSERFLRKATDAELAAAKGPATLPAAKPAPKTNTVAQAPTTQPANQPAAQPKPTPAPGSSPAPGAAAPSAQPTTTPPAASPGGAADPTSPGSPPANAQPTDPAATPPVAPPPAPKAPDRRIAEFEALNAKYEAIKKVPVEQAEIEPLIAEYQRYIGSLAEGSGSSTRRAVAQGTVELLNARLDLKKAKLAVMEAEKAAANDWKAVAEKKAALDAKPRYTVVGRLSASTIYDGDRLPLMFRILSVEGFPGRTLAYVTPAPGVDVPGRVGMLVGVIGEGNVDASLGVPVLRPSRVDPLTPTGQPAPAAATPPPAQTTP